MKLAKECPIDKGDKQQRASNYRPISLLPTFAKLKKIICHSLTQLEEDKLLYNHQFGFRKQRGTLVAILDFTDRIRLPVDREEIALGLFLDLSKVFGLILTSDVEQRKHGWPMVGNPEFCFRPTSDTLNSL